MLKGLLFLGMMMVAQLGHTQVVIDERFQRAEINHHISVYAPQKVTTVTKENAITLFQLENAFIQNKANSVMLDSNSYGYWLKGKISVQQNAPKTLILKLHYSHLGNSILFLKQQNGRITKKHFYRGNSPEKKHTQLVDTDTAFTLNIENTAAEFLLFIRPQGTSYNVYNVHVTLQTFQQYDAEKYADTAFIALVFGFILAMFLYNFVLYLYVGYKPYVYYCGYLAALFSLDYVATGFGYTGIVNFSTSTNVFLMSASPSFAYLFLVLFGRNILNLSSVYPRMDKFFKVAQWLCPISVLMVFTSFDSINTLLLYSQLTATALLAITAYKVHCKAKLPGALFFSISFIFIVAGSLVHLSMEIWPLEEYISSPETYKVYRWLEQKAFHVFTMVEMIFLSLALASFIRQAEFDKQQAQAEKLTLVTQTLELKSQYSSQLETEVKLRTYELAQRNIELKKLQEIRDKFFAQMTHEFRSPLTLAIAPLSEIRQGKYGKLGEAFDSTLALIERNTLKMLTLVNAMLDLVRHNQYGFTPVNSQVNIDLSLEKIVNNYAFLANNKNISFSLDKVAAKNTEIWFDQHHFDGIFNNLVSNAFKHTPNKGQITLSYRLVNNVLTVELFNSGSFINAEQQQYIFEYLYKNKGATGKDNENSGIGLSYVKELVDLYKGNVVVESDKQRGTKFVVQLPLENQQLAYTQDESSLFVFDDVNNITTVNSEFCQGEAAESCLLDKTQVLLIDDNKELLTYLSNMLTEANYQVLTAEDGEQGYNACVQYSPDIIISDVVMPNVSGLEFVQKIRANDSLKHLPIILLSTQNDKVEQVSGINQGADDYLTKPFIPSELLARLRRIIEQRGILKQKLLQDTNLKNNFVVPVRNNAKASDKADIKAKALAFIYQHASDANFTVERLAKLLFLSRSTLHRQLTEYHGITPNRLILNSRLSIAAELLKTDYKDEILVNVAYAVGFNSQSYFSKKFSEKYKMSPKKWQQQKQHNTELV